MNLKKYLIPVLVIAFIGILAVGWYLGSPLFFDRTVDEAFPFELPPQEEIDQMTEAEKSALESDFLAAIPSESELSAMSEDDKNDVEEKVLMAAAAMPDHQMEDPMPEASGDTAGPTLVLEGQFRDADSFHLGSGAAKIFQLQDGSRVLRFEDFMVTNGPDLHVLLAAGENPTDQSDLGDYIDLGQLKGNVGNQNYEIPNDVDISAYNSIVIYCLPFHVVFSTAQIS